MRMTAWLLHVLAAAGSQPAGPSRDLWQLYISLLPPERECCCLLSYAEGREREELQLPRLVVRVPYFMLGFQGLASVVLPVCAYLTEYAQGRRGPSYYTTGSAAQRGTYQDC